MIQNDNVSVVREEPLCNPCNSHNWHEFSQQDCRTHGWKGMGAASTDDFEQRLIETAS